MLIEKEVRDINRLRDILNVLLRNELGPLIRALHMPFWHRKPKIRVVSPDMLLTMFEELGGTFIKLGQLLSIRPDLLPREYCDAFIKLQDQVPPVAYDEVKKVVEQELGKPLTSAFASFSKQPLASASIGQVHLGRLKTGKMVAVKVQRPGIKAKIDADVDILYALARFIQRHYKPKLFNPVEIVKEFERYTQHETDYVLEGKNIDRFAFDFREDPEVVVPKVCWELTTQRVLTMDYLPGKKASSIKGSTAPKILVERVVRVLYKQVFEHGFFHADPHPGNIIVLPKNRIAFVDFGIMGTLEEETRDSITFLFISLIRGDVDGISDALYQLGVVDSTMDPMKLKHGLRESFGEYYRLKLENIEIESVFHSLLRFCNEQHIVLPTDFILLGKAVVTVEGFAKSVDPDFNLVAFSKPYVERLLLRRASPLHVLRTTIHQAGFLKNALFKLPRQFDELMIRAREGDRYFNEINQDLKGLTVELEKTSERVCLSLLCAGLIIAGALILALEQPLLFRLPLYSALCFLLAALFLLMLTISVLSEPR
ncbi:MAG: AarF/ABC1/UbiB kinase family protein [Nanoarchaeota archaeon]